jgi:hypothetical protein
MKESLEMILLQSGSDRAGSGRGNYCRAGGPRCPYNSRGVRTGGAKDARRSKRWQCRGVLALKLQSCELRSFYTDEGVMLKAHECGPGIAGIGTA